MTLGEALEKFGIAGYFTVRDQERATRRWERVGKPRLMPRWIEKLQSKEKLLENSQVTNKKLEGQIERLKTEVKQLQTDASKSWWRKLFGG